MAQVKLRFYLPLRDNDGRALVAEILDVQRELTVRFSGWTNTGVVKGTFRMANESVVIDESNSYELVTDDARIPEVEATLRAFKARTTQEAIYFEVVYNTEVRYL